ncbi:MAG: hypothetical protein PHY92_07290 [Alphaproteobacteria bacterium]|nr:hypothetical protein [Alphaproteobacteria bacterium]
MTHGQNPPSLVLKEIHDLQQFFTGALALLDAGEISSMSGVDKRISAVCQAAQNSPPEQQQVYLPELTILIDLLNHYEKDLRKLQAALNAASSKGGEDGAAN